MTMAPTFPFVDRICRIFSEHPDNDAVALVLHDYVTECMFLGPANRGPAVSAAVAWIVKREGDNDRAHIYQDRETTERLGGGTARPLIYGDTVPDGFVLVPVGALPEMLCAAGTMEGFDVDAGYNADQCHSDWYAAMIAAAPRSES